MSTSLALSSFPWKSDFRRDFIHLEHIFQIPMNPPNFLGSMPPARLRKLSLKAWFELEGA